MEKIRLDIQKFASGTIDGSSTASRCDCRIVWSSTSNGSYDNSSSVTASIQILKTGSGKTTGTFSGTITINGTNYNVSKKFSPYNYGNWATVGSKTVTIPHNADGTKTITISGKLTQTGTTMAGTYTASGTAVLDTINRLSTITSVTKTTIDKPFSITFPDYGLYYDLHVSYINPETLTGGIVLEVRDVKNNTNYSIPSDVIPGLYEVFTGSSGINLWVKLNVYADEARSKPIYTNSSQDAWESIVVNFGYGNIPPTASIEITGEQNTTMKSLNWGIYVQGKSQIGVKINGTAQYGATITGRSSSTNGITYNQSSYTTGTITAPGDNLVKARVTDSRGQQSSEASSSYYVYPYAQPSVTLHSAERCDANGNVNDKGTYLRIAFSSNIYACNNNNSKSISVYAGDYSSVISTSYSNSQTVSIVNANLSSSSSYDIKLKATDSFTTVTSNTIRLSTSDLADIFHFNKSGKSLAIGCKSTRGENEKALDIGLDTTISGNETVNGIIKTENVVSRNLLYTPYTENNKLIGTANRDDYYWLTEYYVYLEQGKTYTFSAKTDGNWGSGDGTDTVECFLMKDKGYENYFNLKNGDIFTCQSSGNYYLRYDINQNGKTHSFWDFQVEEGTVATPYVPYLNLEEAMQATAKANKFIEVSNKMKFLTNTSAGTTVTLNLGNVGGIYRSYAFFLFISGRNNWSENLSCLQFVRINNTDNMGTPNITSLTGETGGTYSVSVDSNNDLILSVTSSIQINLFDLDCICIAL